MPLSTEIREAFYTYLQETRSPSTASQYVANVTGFFARLADPCDVQGLLTALDTYSISSRHTVGAAWRVFAEWINAYPEYGLTVAALPSASGTGAHPRGRRHGGALAATGPGLGAGAPATSIEERPAPPLWTWPQRPLTGWKSHKDIVMNPGGPPNTDRFIQDAVQRVGGDDWRQFQPRAPISNANAVWSIVKRLKPERFSRAFLLQLAFITDGWVDIELPPSEETLDKIDTHLATFLPELTDPLAPPDGKAHLVWLKQSLGRERVVVPGMRHTGRIDPHPYIVPPIDVPFARDLFDVGGPHKKAGDRLPWIVKHALHELEALPCRRESRPGRANMKASLLTILPHLAWPAVRFLLPIPPPPEAIAQTTIQEKMRYYDADWEHHNPYVEIMSNAHDMCSTKRLGEMFPWAYTVFGPDAVGPFLVLLAAGQWTIDEASFGLVPVLPLAPGNWDAGGMSARQLTAWVSS